MAEETFSSIGLVEAIERLYEGCPYKAFDSSYFITEGKSVATVKTRTLLEGIDFDLVYFPLTHLGYKSVISVTGELYAEFSRPRTLDVVLGLSSKLDFEQVKELWKGIVKAAEEHSYAKLNLELIPSRNGLCISLAASGECSLLECKRRPAAKSMDLICVSGNLGAAYLGLNVLEREKKNWSEGKNPNLDKYRQFVGAYLKPELQSGIIDALVESDIYPSFGYFINKGLGSTLKALVRDSGLGAKIYVDRIPFEGNSFDTGKELGIDPVTAALNGGDDYRLLFTIPIRNHDRFRHDFQTFDIIGHLARPEAGAVLVTPDGLEHPIKAQGWSQK